MDNSTIIQKTIIDLKAVSISVGTGCVVGLFICFTPDLKNFDKAETFLIFIPIIIFFIISISALIQSFIRYTLTASTLEINYLVIRQSRPYALKAVEFFSPRVSTREVFQIEYRLKFKNSHTFRIPRTPSSSQLIHDLEVQINIQASSKP